jgi:hypothetical protein
MARTRNHILVPLVAEEMSGLDKAKLNELLDPSKQCEPGGVEMAGSGG